MTDTVRSFMDKKAVAQVLEQIAEFLELKGENPFRIRAFRTAARAVNGFPADLRNGLEDGSLAATKGIGPATLQIVSEIAATGRVSMLEELREQIPPGLVEMLSVSGLGVAKIRQIHEVLDIDSLPELEAAALDGRLNRLPRFGPKTSENILKGIAFLRQASAYRLSHHAADEAEGLRAALERRPAYSRRRRRRRAARWDLVRSSWAGGGIHSAGANCPACTVAGQDQQRMTLRFAGGASARVVVNWRTRRRPSQATGSEAHLRRAARRRGLAWEPRSGGAACSADAGRGHLLSLWADSLRPEPEGRGEIEPPQHALPGLPSAPTPWTASCSPLLRRPGWWKTAIACRDAGYEYVGITDHSQAAAYAGGLKADDVARQADEIDEVNARLEGFRVLKGVEADILQDGRIDFDDAVLARLDFVIASVHSRFNMGEREMTARMLAAMDNPHLTIIGHPTGRLLLSRDPYGLDLEAVIEKAAATGVALEINADPHRLDLDWRVLRHARERGAAISIGADAHNVSGLANVEYGVGIARKGWLGPADILNALPVEGLLAHATRRRAG
jgi:DNA polymerase (family 10)